MFGEKELQVLYHMSRGRRTVSELSECLGISVPETYRKIRLLRSKDVIEGKDPIRIGRCPHAKRLMMLMSEGPGMAKYLSGDCLDVLVSLLAPCTPEGISEVTGISESHVRRILRLEIEGGFVRKTDGEYSLECDALPDIRPFLMSYRDYTEVSDPRLSDDSEILFRKGRDVVFSSDSDQGFRPTGASVFEEYGMHGMSDSPGFFTTEAGELSLDDMFEDAVRIAEAKNDWRLRMYNELFYIRNSGMLDPPSDFLEKHGRIMSGDRIDHWPSKEDIEDRMWMVVD